VELDLDGVHRRYRVVSVERKLPPHDAGTETPAPV
jgi:hypothetical protein